jgi:hypothetical protein
MESLTTEISISIQNHLPIVLFMHPRAHNRIFNVDGVFKEWLASIDFDSSADETQLRKV